MTRIALIPAYEPDTHLLPLLRQVREAGLTAVVVDDGSGEGYRDLFSRASQDAVLLTHPCNWGKGQALKTGFRYIQTHFPANSTVVTLDADGQHAVADAVRCAQAAEQHPDGLVLGCRSFQGHVPLRSQLGNGVTRLVYRLSSGIRVSDTQTGLRAFSADWIPFLLGIDGDRYEYEMNVLLACARQKIPMREVSIATIYENRNASSHFHTIRDSVRIYRDILKFAGSSLIGFAVDYSLYSLLVILTAPWGAVSVPLSNVAARIVSATTNYTINRNLVFHSRESVLRTGTQYFTLAACILCGNTLLLSWLVGGLGVNRFAAKLVTEVTFFSISWIFQKLLIFKKRETGREANHADI